MSCRIHNVDVEVMFGLKLLRELITNTIYDLIMVLNNYLDVGMIR